MAVVKARNKSQDRRLRFRDATLEDVAVIAALQNAAAGAVTARFGPGHWSSLVTERSAALSQRHARVRVGSAGTHVLTVLRLATKRPWAIEDSSVCTAAEKPSYPRTTYGSVPAPREAKHAVQLVGGAMGTPGAIAIIDRHSRMRMWLGLVLLGAGLLGHLLAAQAIGGSRVAYRDHIFGFVALSLVSGAIIAGLGWRFWRGRHDITVLTLGILQALLGLAVYVERFRVHG